MTDASGPGAAAPVVIRARRWKTALAVLAGVGFVAVGVWAIGRGGLEGMIIGGVGVLVFGPMTLAGFGLLIRPSELRLDGEGFQLSGGFRRPVRPAWADIEHFLVWSSHGTRLVGWLCRPGRKPKGALAAANRKLGLDGALPTGWPLGPEALFALMETWRARADRF